MRRISTTFVLQIVNLSSKIAYLIFFLVMLVYMRTQAQDLSKNDSLDFRLKNAADSISQFASQTLATNDFFYIMEVSITGNVRTKKSIILREVSIKAGDSIPQAKADSMILWEKNRIFNTNLFITTEVFLVPTDNKKTYILHIKLREQWYTIPQIYLEFADRNINEWYFERGADPRRINGGIRLLQRNVRGRNETLRITLQGGFTNTYELGYEIPYLDKNYQWGLGFMASYSNNISIAAATQSHKLIFLKSEDLSLVRNFYRANTTVFYRPKFFSKHSAEFNYHYNLIADTIARYNPDFFGNGQTTQRYSLIKYTFENDTRDRKQYAHKGFFLKVELEQLGYLPVDQVQMLRGTFTCNLYKTLNKYFYLATKIKTKVSSETFQPFNEFRALGYQENWVRGFERYVIDGHHYFLNRNSFRLKCFSAEIDFKKWIPVRQFRVLPLDGYLTLFADWGIVQSRFSDQIERFNNTMLSNKPIASIGAGFHLVTFYNSVLRFEVVYNSLGEVHPNFSFATDI